MKPNSYRDSEAPHATGPNVGDSRSARERRMQATNARPPPAAPYRRYPSLSDDRQPYFSHLRRPRRDAEDNAPTAAANENDGARFFSVRVVAFLLLVALIAALAAKK